MASAERKGDVAVGIATRYTLVTRKRYKDDRVLYTVFEYVLEETASGHARICTRGRQRTGIGKLAPETRTISCMPPGQKPAYAVI